MSLITHILAPTDFSAPASHSLAFAIGLARDFKAELTLLHVAESWGDRVSGADARDLDPEIAGHIRQQALDLLEAYETTGIPEVHVETAAGRASRAIAEVAQRVGVDLIVMGSHGTSALEHALLGSTAEAVLRLAPCPVYTIRYPEHKFVLPYIGG